MGLKDVLTSRGIQLPEDFDERMDLMVAALRKDPSYKEKLTHFKRQRGGGPEQEDWLGPKLQAFIDGVSGPGAQVAWKSLFGVLFLLKYLESIPAFGSILGAALDLLVMGGKMMTKTLQKVIPTVFGLIPLPFMNIVGLMFAAALGMILWPILAIVSFSRTDFTSAVDSFIRIIPPPLGETIADLFLEANRTVAKLEVRRQQIAEQISSALDSLANVITGVKENATALGQKTLEAANVEPVQRVSIPTVGGRKRTFRRRKYRHTRNANIRKNTHR
jgi:hypothetical protein